MTAIERLQEEMDQAYAAYLVCDCKGCEAWTKWIFGSPLPETPGCKSLPVYRDAWNALEARKKAEPTPEKDALAVALAEWTACECADCMRFMAGVLAADTPPPKTCPLWRAYDAADTAWNRAIEVDIDRPK